MLFTNGFEATLIIDQCSKVFFDRTQPTDDRPEVMDLFAQAIGTVVCITDLSLLSDEGEVVKVAGAN